MCRIVRIASKKLLETGGEGTSQLVHVFSSQSDSKKTSRHYDLLVTCRRVSLGTGGQQWQAISASTMIRRASGGCSNRIQLERCWAWNPGHGRWLGNCVPHRRLQCLGDLWPFPGNSIGLPATASPGALVVSRAILAATASRTGLAFLISSHTARAWILQKSISFK